MPNWKKIIVSGSDASLNSLNVATALTASGLIYPTIDGTIGQVITTDGAGNLTLSNVDNTRITIKNVSGGTIPKGTPLYITGSGTMGNIAGVFPADAGNPDRMPAGAIAGETLADEAEGVGLINGFINGVNTSAFESGDEVFVAVGGGYTNIPPTGSVGGNIVLIQKLGNVEKVSPTNGSGVITGPGTFRSVPNIQPGYTWVGDADYVAQAVSTASLFVTSASYAFEATSASYAFNSTSSSYALTASYFDGPLEGAKTFEQTSANVTWSFVHNFNTYTPIVQVYDSSYNQLLPAGVVGVSDDTTEIYFAYPETGFAIISTGGNLLITGSNAKLVQTAAAATWSFEHGLGEQFPVFTIFDDNNDVIIPTRITADNAYTASIYFSSARTGTAVAANCGLSGSTFDTAISSSYALTASFALDFNPAATASYALEALTSSFALEALTASYALEALTSSFAQTASYVDPLNQIVVLTQVSESLNFADDAAAALGGVPLGGLYRNGNFILIRLV